MLISTSYGIHFSSNNLKEILIIRIPFSFMSLQEWVNWLLNSGSGIVAVAVFDTSGTCRYTTDNWKSAATEGHIILNAWKSGQSQFDFGGVSFAVLKSDNERLISTNVGKQGHIVGTLSVNGKLYVIGFVSPESDFYAAYRDLAQFADGIENIL